MSGPEQSAQPPVISIVAGNPTPEEIAAVTAVLLSVRRPTPSAPSTSRGQWSAYWQRLRAPIPPGSDAWRQSARR